MDYTTLVPQRSRREMVTAFGGYNHRRSVASGEFYDMRNLTSDAYPLLSPRRQRGFYTGGSDIRRLYPKEQLCYADGGDLVIGQEHYNLGLTAANTSFVSMGAYLIVLPDKVYINTADPADRGQIEARFTAPSAHLRLCREDGSEIALTDGLNPQEGDHRFQEGLQLYAGGKWEKVLTTFIRLEAEGIGADFRAGDGVHLEGAPQVGGTAVIQAVGKNHLVLPGLVESTLTLQNVTVQRRVPTLDFCVEAGNRLWGCRYGPDRDGNLVNQLYACKLGDFRNWECFQGLSTDSYQVSLGSDGAFTGAITYLGYPLFFKEEQIHRVYGSCPANFQVQSDGCRGVQRGSDRSLAIVGETLYYKSRLGVCAYTGSLPVDVSAQLGEDAYHGAVAGAHGWKYFISMADQAGVYHLFVYDTLRSMWHREDNTQALDFASYDNDLYFIDGADRQIKTVYGTGSARYKTPIRWMAQSGILGVDDPDHKYFSKLQLRMQLGLNSVVDVYLRYDSGTRWQYAGTVKATGTRTATLPLRLRRCDHVEYKLEGRGEAKVYSITTTVEEGK